MTKAARDSDESSRSNTCLTKPSPRLIDSDNMQSTPLRKPPWIRLPAQEGPAFSRVRKILKDQKLGTVCEDARCPNRSECWGCGTATFLLMGHVCTRGCHFCSVRSARSGEPLDVEEPERIATAVSELGLRFVVLTSVTRDDLEDGGAGHYARTMAAIRAQCPDVGIEVLSPDFQGENLKKVLEAEPQVFAHNMEVVRELTPKVRDKRSSYDRSLAVLEEAKRLRPDIKTKSSLLLGLGETREQIVEALDDLRRVNVDILCIGQYLQPGKRQLPVQRYVTPEEFAELETLAKGKGFSSVASGPLVRTSYRAAEFAGTDSQPLTILRPGRLAYVQGLELQKKLEARRIEGKIGDTLIVLEHDPVITLGHRAKSENILASRELLGGQNIEIHQTNRGGDVTYHGPRQIVMYPIVNLHERRMGSARFVEILEETMLRALSDLGIRAQRISKLRGIFVDNEKIGAVGIHVSRGVTTHGLALNVDPDLSHFDMIVPCGLKEHRVTSIRKVLGKEIVQKEVEDSLVRHFEELLDRFSKASSMAFSS